MISTFFKAFVKNFLKATALELIVVLVVGVAAGDFWFAMNAEQPIRTLYVAVGTIIALLALILFIMAFPQQSIYRNTLFNYLKNSLVLAACSVTLATVLGVLGALGQARARMKKGWRGRALRAGQGLIENIAVLPTMLPEIILGVAFLLLFSALGLPSGMLTLTLAHTTFCMPYVYLLVKSRLATMGDEMENAARDLGATPLRALLTVTLPLLRPAVFSGALLALAMSLDDFVISFFVSGAGGSTLPLKIYSSARYGVSAQINALCTVMLAAVFLLVGLSQWALRKKR